MTLRSCLLRVAFACSFGLLARSALAEPMTFEVVPFGEGANCASRCTEVVRAVGEITSATPRDFYNFLSAHVRDPRLRAIVFLHSPGGSVAASMRLGRMFRKAGVAAIVARLARVSDDASSPAMAVPGGRCYSACVYALMGAKKRVVPPPSLIGIHRMAFEETERDLSTLSEVAHETFGTPEFVAQLADYAQSMGVSKDVIYTAEKVAPENIHIVTPAELRRWRLGSLKF